MQKNNEKHIIEYKYDVKLICTWHIKQKQINEMAHTKNPYLAYHFHLYSIYTTRTKMHFNKCEHVGNVIDDRE